MGWTFELAVECGTDHEAAAAVKEHFDGLTFQIDGETNGQWMVEYLSEDEDGRWWVTVLPFIRGRPLESVDDPQMLAAAARKLYDRLRSAPQFRFAVVGNETFQFNRAEALHELLGHPALRGLVVSEELFETLGRPIGFAHFSDGYRWLPPTYNYT